MPSQFARDGRVRCLAVLLIAAVHAAVYVFLVPPWNHYDEPTHFEYAWLIANHLRLPQQDDVNHEMRREVAASMLEHGFYRDIKFDPKVLIQAEPIWIGVSELSHPPLYYMLVALPLRFLRHSEVRTQLYAGRVFSGLLYLSSIAIAFCLVAELVGRDHPLSWIVPATLALVPSYADLMTSVNNDVGAVVVMSLFLWGAVRTIQRGLTVGHVAWVVLAALACVYTKNSAAVAAILAPIALVFGWAIPRGRRVTRWLIGAGLGVVLLLLPIVFSWGNAAIWVHITPPTRHTSQVVAQAPVGKRALALGVGGHAKQFLPRTDVQALQDEVITLGAWIWSDRPATVRGLSLSDGQSTRTAPNVELGTSPAFYTVTTTVSSEASHVIVSLDPRLSQDDPAQVVYYDGLVLVEGEPPPHTAPRFDGPRGEAGRWAGQPFVNRLRNGSAETTWPYVRPFVDRLLQQYTRRSPSRFLTSLLDWERSKGFYPVAATILLQTFWARFGWNHIPLPPAWYWVLAVVTLVGVAGAVVAYLRLRRHSNVRRRAAVELLAIAALLVWANAFLRVHPVDTRVVIPAARYVYPAIAPTLLALAGGWWSLPPRRSKPWAMALVICGLLALDGMSIWTVARFHSGMKGATMPLVLKLATLWSLGLLAAYLVLPKRDLSALAARRWAPWAVIAIALLVRLIPNLCLPGGAGYDIGSYSIVGDLVLERTDVYASPLALKRYPYLPLQMYWSALAKWLSLISGAPFVKIVRLLPIASDAAIALLILKGVQRLSGSRQAGLLGGLLYACNPISVLVSAYHGQFDSVPALFVLLAWYVWLQGKTERRRLLGSAFWMGMAILIKSWPVLLLPILAWQVKGWRKRLLYLATSGAVSLGAILFYLLVFSGDPALLISRVLSYNHGVGMWGYTFPFRFAWDWLPASAPVFMWFVANGRYITLAALAAVFLTVARRQPGHEGLLTILVTFFACTHAFSIQYLVWIVPFGLLAGQRKWLTWYTLGAMLYMLPAYMTLVLDGHITPLLPWPQAHGQLIILAGLPAWLVTVRWMWVRLTARQ